jgi:signal transduction histidine kinase
MVRRRGADGAPEAIGTPSHGPRASQRVRSFWRRGSRASLAARVARSATLAAVLSALLAAVVTSGVGSFLLQKEEDRRLFEAARDLVYLLGASTSDPAQVALTLRHEQEETEHAGTRFRVSWQSGQFMAGDLADERVEPGQCSTRTSDQLRVCSVEAPSGALVTAASAHVPHTSIFFIAALVAAIFAGLVTWLWSVPMVRSAIAPLSRLRARVATIDVDVGDGADQLGSDERVAEVDELRATIRQLLGRVGIALDQAQRFAANAAHELRTPLTAVRAELDLFGEHPGIPADVAGNVATAQGKIADLIVLVERLLILAKPRQAPTAPSEIVSLHDVLEDVLRGLEPALADRASLTEADALVRGDALLLGTLFANALTNALKFGERVLVGVSVAEGEACISVEDDGPGLEESERERVFEPFYRGHGAVRERQPGHGLGLALVRHIAESHGGSAAFEPREGRGARLVIRLPEL